jgi:hypothetical protein
MTFRGWRVVTIWKLAPTHKFRVVTDGITLSSIHMNANSYYIGGEQVLLDKEESRARLIQRLRQYLELRNFNVLIGNGASLPLGTPRIGDVSAIRPELTKEPYRLAEQAYQERAIKLLDKLLTKKGSIGVEPLLTVLANSQ